MISSRITLGCMSLGEDSGDRWNSGRFVPDKDTGITWVRRAIDTGIIHLDTAQGYGNGQSERWLGEALQTVPRESVQVTTKIGRAVDDHPHPFCAANIRAVCDQALRNLGLERLDYFMFHHLRFDDYADEALATMQELVEAGKIGSYAACPIFGLRDTAAQWPGLHPGHWHTHGGPFWLITTYIDLSFAADRDEPVVIFAPYLYGLLTGRWGVADRPAVEQRFQQHGWRHPWFFDTPEPHGFYNQAHDIGETLAAIDRVKRAFSVDADGFRSLLLRYCWALPAVQSICIGFSRWQHIEETLAAAAAPPLDAAECQLFRELILPTDASGELAAPPSA